MFSALTNFLNNLLDDSPEQAHDTLSLEVACTVLLFEVIKADGVISIEEQERVIKLTSQQFALPIEEVKLITEQAFNASENAIDFFEFTRKVNQHYSIEQRIEIVKLLWDIAYADNSLSSIEEHTIRRIADLLHLKHTEYIATKPVAQ